MRKHMYLCAALFAAVSCAETVDVEDSVVPVVFGVSDEMTITTKGAELETFASDSVFNVAYEAFSSIDTLVETKASVVTQASLTSFYLNTTRGGTEVPVASNTLFSGSVGSNYSGGLFWPASNQSYHFYASNIQMLSGTDCSKIVCSPEYDIIYAYLPAPSYKTENTLSFRHVYARIGSLSLNPPSGMTVTLKSAAITARRSGTFDMKTESWVSTSGSESVSLSSSNDAWVIPGSYDISVTYDITNGIMLQENLVRSGMAVIAGNHVNNIIANVTFDDYITSYSQPYGLAVSCDDIPASGGTLSAAAISGTCRQKAFYASSREEELTITDYSVSWSSAVSASSLGSSAQSRTKVGTLTLTYTANGQSASVSCDAYQAENSILSSSYGEWSYGTKNYGTVAYGDKVYGSTSYGDKSYGSWVYGDKSYGDEYAGTTTYGAEYLGSTSTGSEYGAGKSYGSEYAGAKSYGTATYGAWTDGAKSYGASSSEYQNYSAYISASPSTISAAGGTVTLSWSASHEQRTATQYSIAQSRAVYNPWTQPIYKDWSQAVYRDDVKHYVKDGTTPYYRDYTRSMSRDWTRSTSTPWSRSTSTPWTRTNTRTRTDSYSSGATSTSTDYGSDSGTDTGSDSGTDTGTDSGTDTSTDSGTDLSRNVASTAGTRDVSETVYIRTDSGTEHIRTDSGTDTSSETGTPKTGTEYSSWTAVGDTPSISGSAAGFSRSGAYVTVSANTDAAARYATYYATNNGASNSVTITQTGDYIANTVYNISPIYLSKNYFGPEGGTATISGGDCTITYSWASGRTTYGTFTPQKYTNNSWSSVSGTTLTVSQFDDGMTNTGFVYYRHPDGICGDAVAYFTQVGFSSLVASVSKSTIYYGQSTTVSVTANYTDGTSADVTSRSSISVPEAGSYTSVSGTTYTHTKSGQTTNYTLNGTATYAGKTTPFSFTIGMRSYDMIEIVSGTNGRSTTKPSFKARWNDTKTYDSKSNGSCDYWTVDGSVIAAGDEVEAKNYSSGEHTFTVYYTNQIGTTLQATISVSVSSNKWYYN